MITQGRLASIELETKSIRGQEAKAEGTGCILRATKNASEARRHIDRGNSKTPLNRRQLSYSLEDVVDCHDMLKALEDQLEGFRVTLHGNPLPGTVESANSGDGVDDETDGEMQDVRTASEADPCKRTPSIEPR